MKRSEKLRLLKIGSSIFQSAELKAEIEEAKKETEKRYKKELDALETQKQKEAEWYKGVMQQLNAESEQLDANHREKMKELRDEMVSNNQFELFQSSHRKNRIAIS